MKRFMKRVFLAGVLSLLFAQGALGYVNQGIVINPDFVIDDPLFVNENGAEFRVYLDTLRPFDLTPYRTFNTLNYTNFGLMESDLGFQLDTYSGGLTRWANSFYNDTFGVVNSGTRSNGFIFYSSYSSPDLPTPMLIVSATNVLNRGWLSLAPEGVMAINGRNVNLSRSRMNVAAYEYMADLYSFYIFGQFDGYWGSRDVEFNPAGRFGGFTGSTPLHWVTNRSYLANETSLFGSPYVRDISYPATSNRIVNAAFILNSNPADFKITPYDFGNDMLVEWEYARRDPISGTNALAYLHLFDDITSVSNIVLITNGLGPPRTGYRPTFIPTNYYFSASTVPYTTNVGFAIPAGAATAGLFPNTNITREFSAYQLMISPTMSLPGDYFGRSYTNMPGRLEVVAQGPGSSLNLQRARIYGVNSLVLKATNHFAGSGGARIVTPFADLDLGSPNGSLVISNLLVPVVPRLDGYVDVWSTRFTNVTSDNWTNSYHVLFVNSFLQPSVQPQLQNLSLRGTNVYISDVLNVLSNLTLEAQNVTIVSNAPGVMNPTGELNLLSGEVFYPSSSPGLLRLTNYGRISSYNLMFFTNQTRPYEAFVNYGTVTNAGSLIAADYFRNSGIFRANSGLLSLRCPDAWLQDGYFLAPTGDLSLRGDRLTVSNHVLLAGRALNLTVTNWLDDGTLLGDGFTVTSKNFWSVNAGINLLVKPAQGSLLGTTVHSTSPPDGEVLNLWAADDLGQTPAGFVNNTALGHLILDAGRDSNFRFAGTGPNKALYVDRLELRNFATNIDAGGNFPAIALDPNFKLYYGEAVMNGFSVAERMNGRNGGQLQWVSGQAGFFSATNVAYPDGTIHRLNSALVASCSLDSNNNGSANCIDPAPVWVASQYRLSAALTNGPVPAIVLTWRTVGSATNSIYTTTNLAEPSWQLLTNFVSEPAIGPPLTKRFGAALGAGPRFYRVQVDVP